ncbi:MAG: lysine-sensitive aspartokinase 3 [Bdellovibrionales bacterium]|nr:lysine-sensitive aspartokinase 3 [Bdellovibrionales bacterium]
MITVKKFGGTSVQTPQAMRRAADIVSKDQTTRVVVLSAVRGVTDKLLAWVDADQNGRATIAREIRQIHLDLINALELTACEKVILETMDFLKAKSSQKISLADLDEVLSIGEKLSSFLFVNFMTQRGHRVRWLDAKEVICTDNHHGKAVPDIEAIRLNCKKKNLHSTDTVFVTQGFIGTTKNGYTTTLGRGGSDYSAALFAEGIEASELHIYTDVPGVYTMDPNIVPSAKPISCLGFGEMAEMANFGAKILHPATLVPCVRGKIPVKILSTFHEDHEGTSILPFSDVKKDSESPSVRAITMRPKQVLVTIRSLNMLDTYGFLATVFGVLSKYKISVDLITTSEVSVALTIDGTSVGSNGVNPFNNAELLAELNQISELSVEESLTLIAVIGKGLNVPGMVQNILSNLHHYTVRLICFGASPSSVGILVKNDDAPNVARSLHEAFIERNSHV